MPGRLQRFRQLAIRRLLGCAEAAAALGALFSVAAIFGRWWWFADVFTHLQVLLAACFVLYSLIELLRRRWIFLAASLAFAALDIAPAAWMFISAGAPLQAPPRSADAPRPVRLRVLQANILTSNTNSPALLALIAREDPDIILLQEPNRRWLREIGPALASRYPVSASEPLEDNFGIAAFAKPPSARAEIIWLDDEASVPAARVSVAYGNRAVALYGIHVAAPYNNYTWNARNRCAGNLARRAAAEKGAKIVAGDFNNTPWAPSFRSFVRVSGLRDATTERGIMPTWPAGAILWMRIPLDHCLHSPELRLVSRRRGPDIGSDHFPVISDFEF